MNINMLKGKIIERGMSVAMLAEKIGMDRATLYRKMSNDGDTMLVKDANAIIIALSLSVAEAVAIFFGYSVAQYATSRAWENNGGVWHEP